MLDLCTIFALLLQRIQHVVNVGHLHLSLRVFYFAFVM
jgi:hypothetical protein